MAAEIERDLISKRTKEALKSRKAQGVKLGRPKDPGKSKLDKYREEIIALLKNGSTKAYVAKKYGTTQPKQKNFGSFFLTRPVMQVTQVPIKPCISNENV